MVCFDTPFEQSLTTQSDVSIDVINIDEAECQERAAGYFHFGTTLSLRTKLFEDLKLDFMASYSTSHTKNHFLIEVETTLEVCDSHLPLQLA